MTHWQSVWRCAAALLLAAVAGARAKNCFVFEGALQRDNDVRTYHIGQTIELRWTSDSFFCDGASVDTPVRIELWEDDSFLRGGDDFVAEIVGVQDAVLEAENPFKWTVPYDLTTLLDKSGESESASDFFFVVIAVENGGWKGESVRFKVSSRESFITIEGPRSRSFATGSLIEFDVLVNGLPQRELQCDLMKERFGAGGWLGVTTVDTIERYEATSAKGVQKRVVQYRPTGQVDSGNNYYLECRTVDGIKPVIKHVLSMEKWFRIEKLELTLNIVSPEAESKVKANTNMPVRWTTNLAGVAPDERVTVRLFRYVVPRSHFGVAAIFLTNHVEVWSTSSGEAERPRLADGEFDLPVPPGLGPVSWLNQFASGQTDQFFVRLTLDSNRDFQRQSSNFYITEADKACIVTKPSVDDALVFGGTNAIAYECKGYAPEAKIGLFQLVELDSRNLQNSVKQRVKLDNDKRALTKGEFLHDMPPVGTQGWVYRVEIDDGSGDARPSHIFLAQHSGKQCSVAAGGQAATCKATPVLAALYEHEHEVVDLAVDWAGPNCGAAMASMTLTTRWRKHSAPAIVTTTTTARLIDNRNTTQKLLGDECPDCVDVAFEFVEYPNNRRALSFDLLLLLPSQRTAPLRLGRVQFTDANGCGQEAVKNPQGPKPTDRPVSLNTNPALPASNGNSSETGAQAPFFNSTQRSAVSTALLALLIVIALI